MCKQSILEFKYKEITATHSKPKVLKATFPLLNEDNGSEAYCIYESFLNSCNLQIVVS